MSVAGHSYLKRLIAITCRLDPIKPAELGDEGKALGALMKDRLEAASNLIQDCSHATDEYYKSKFISEFILPPFCMISVNLTSCCPDKMIRLGSWGNKFADYATNLANLANGFESDLHQFTGTGVQTINRSVNKIQETMDSFMRTVFGTLLSPEEKEFNKFIAEKGGLAKVTKDETLLKDLVRKRQAQESRSHSAEPQGNLSSKLKQNADDMLNEIKEEIKTDLDAALDNSRKYFNLKFEEQKSQIAGVKETIARVGERVIERILSGAHNRIIDEVCYSRYRCYLNHADTALGATLPLG